MKDLLEQLDGQRITLDECDDRISAAIAQVEEHLKRHVKIRVTLNIGNDRSIDFGKIDGNWRLIHGEGDDEEPLASSNRDVRAEMFAAGHIEALIRSIAEQFDQRIAERTRAIESAQRIIDALRSAT